MIIMFAKILGCILVALGVMGFIPIFNPHNLLLDVFRMSPGLNILDIIAGLMLCVAGFSENWEGSRRVSLIVTVVYAIIAVFGFLSSTGMVFGMPINIADNILHLSIAVVALLFSLPQRYAMPR